MLWLQPFEQSRIANIESRRQKSTKTMKDKNDVVWLVNCDSRLVVCYSLSSGNNGIAIECR